MAESLNDIVSRIVLQHNMAEEDKLEEALKLQREIMDTEGKKQSLERVLLDMGIIKGKQLKGLRYAILYYLVRKADRFYGKIAVQSDICEPKWVDEALTEQKKVHQKERRLVRLNKILLEKGYINAREDRAILRAIEGVRAERKKKKTKGDGKKKQKKSEKVAVAAGKSSDIAELDLDDVEDAAPASKKKGEPKTDVQPIDISDLEDEKDADEETGDESEDAVDSSSASSTHFDSQMSLWVAIFP